MIGISIGRKGDTYKDTAQNILAREEFVVNIADRDHPARRGAVGAVTPGAGITETCPLGQSLIGGISDRPP